MEALKSLGIDPWAIVLYLVNFGLLLAILTKFLYKPVLKFLDERRETVRHNLEEADKLRVTLSEERAKRLEEAKASSAESARQVAAAKAEAEAKSRVLLAEAEERREKLMAEAEADIADRKRKLVDQVEGELLKRVEAVALRVLQDKVPEKVVAESVSQAWKELNV